MKDQIEPWLHEFRLDRCLHAYTTQVLLALPAPVLADLIEDPRFLLADYDPTDGRGMNVPVRSPGKNSNSRSVIFKRTLRHRPPAFACYVIAHELAHAHLRNAGRWPGDDPERAADALAAEWGFPRPK